MGEPPGRSERSGANPRRRGNGPPAAPRRAERAGEEGEGRAGRLEPEGERAQRGRERPETEEAPARGDPADPLEVGSQGPRAPAHDLSAENLEEARTDKGD